MARSPFEPSNVASRRGGPVKQPLSRDVIVTEALRQLTADGLKGMSLRKVAAALETGPASLYAYVDDLDALYALVLDRALEEVDTRGAAKTGWRDRLLGILESYARVLSARAGLAQLAFGTIAIGPNALRITEALLALLDEGGVDVATAAWAVDLLVLYVTAIVAEHSGGTDPVAPEGAVPRAILAVSEDQHPRIHAAREHLLSGKPQERFGWAIEVLLRGILQSPRAATVKGGPRATNTPRPSTRRKRAP
jgi:AcrR family transcriptional regulator